MISTMVTVDSFMEMETIMPDTGQMAKETAMESLLISQDASLKDSGQAVNSQEEIDP